MERKLASIQKIEKIEPIENADNIVKAKVLEWSCVVKKNEFKEGNLCIFCEIDSVLPSNVDWSQFMKARSFRVKTAKLRGCLSQGLALPLNILPTLTEVYVGKDVSDLLNIKKHETELPDRQEVEGHFPSFIPKTDEIRLQSIPEVLAELANVPFYISTKLDGTSSTFAKLYGKFYVCGRNYTIREGENKYWRMAQKYDLKNLLPDGFAIQGELCGPGIQKNRLNLKEADLFIFNVFDIQKGEYLDYIDFIKFNMELGTTIVPIEQGNVCWEGNKLKELCIEELLNIAKGKYIGTNNNKEGIVVRPMKETFSNVLNGRLSFKIINNDFLLKDEE